jgi:hypothetical protein
MRRSKRARYPNDKVETDTFILKGGLNLVDAAIAIPEGMALAATNYELLSRDGYHRVDGYERFDGQAKPSDASYWILNYTDATGAIEVNGIVTGAISGAAAKILLDVPSGGDAGYLVLTTLTGVFVDDEALSFSGADPSFSSGFSSGFS